MSQKREPVYIVSACRTPVGSFQGGLAGLTAPQLGALAIRQAVQRAGIEVQQVDEVLMGCVLTAGVGQNPARQAALNAGLPEAVPCTTVNKVCASGLKAIALAAQSIALGDQQIVVAGGMESMSQAPYYLNRGQTPYGGIQLKDGVVLDALTDASSGQHMGLCTEQVATNLGLSREQQDDFAIQSYRRTADAYQNGAFDAEVFPVEVPVKRGEPRIVGQDEEFSKANFDKMRTLKPAFKPDGTITAANASTLNDGAAALVLMAGSTAHALGVKPLAEIVGWADAACNPIEFGLAPSLAIPKVLAKAGLSQDDVSLWEINEAFAAVALANQQRLSLPADRLNVHGGAVAIGHPVGMSGARLAVHLSHALARPGDVGCVAVCNGGGGATAVLLRKL